MTRIIEKRRSLHKNLEVQKIQNNDLKLQLGQLQALANIGTATCMIAHEINNLLTPLANYATLSLNNPDDKPLAEKTFKKIIRSSEQASKIMKSMLALTNGQAQENENTPLLTLVEEVFTCLCRDFSKDGMTVNLQIPQDLEVWAVPVEIQQVLMNLILNARDAMMPNGGVLTIKAHQNSDTVQIEVTDSGCGIEPENMDRIFEPLFTTKTKSSGNSGSGFGLAFCKKIIDAHNGSVSVESKPAEGTKFKITLPKP